MSIGQPRAADARRRKAVAVVVAMVAALFASPTVAEYVGPFPNATPVVRIVQNPVDDQLVVVRGTLVKRTGIELYHFKDASGEITVEIDPELFPRANVKPDTPVELRGRVETGWRDGARIEVHSVIVLPAAPRESKPSETPAKPPAAKDETPR